MDLEINNNKEPEGSDQDKDTGKDPARPSRAEFMQAAAENLVAATEENPFSELDDDDFIPDENAYKETEQDIEETNDDRQEPKTMSAAKRKPAKKKKATKKKNGFKKFSAKHKTAMKRFYMVLGAVFCIIFGIYIYACITAPTDRMGRNVYIENVNVSNMTFDEALSAVKKEELLQTQNIVLRCGGQKFEIGGAELGMTAKIEDTVDKAMRFGKTDNVFINGFANMLQMISPHKVMPNANIDETVLREKLRQFGVQIYGELQEHTLEIGDGVVVATPGHTGFDTSEGSTACDKAAGEVLNAISAGESYHNISVTLEKTAPRDYTADDIKRFADKDPEDARYALEKNELSIVPNIDGRVVDAAQAAELVKGLKEGGEVVYIPFSSTPASVTVDTLREKLFNATIGSYSTNYGSSSANRCANVARAASKIDGKILLPGDVFSFNAAVGPRSKANGFYPAQEYLNGETVEGIGGGTCQVSSTLYNACIYADLSIITRTNHMFPVGYCPLGQDATVADTGVDYKFVNSMDYPIKISATTSGYRITVSIIGTQRDDPRSVKIVNTVTREGEDTSVKTKREVYNSAGELISTDQLPASYYKPHH